MLDNLCQFRAIERSDEIAQSIRKRFVQRYNSLPHSSHAARSLLEFYTLFGIFHEAQELSPSPGFFFPTHQRHECDDGMQIQALNIT